MAIGFNKASKLCRVKGHGLFKVKCKALYAFYRLRKSLKSAEQIFISVGSTVICTPVENNGGSRECTFSANLNVVMVRNPRESDFRESRVFNGSANHCTENATEMVKVVIYH
jgi:hypothetical protein